ncbi:hypothetical protein LY12_002518 [Prauserella alba]|nr:hypothetical protein [Prauserella alba]
MTLTALPAGSGVPGSRVPGSGVPDGDLREAVGSTVTIGHATSVVAHSVSASRERFV